MSSNRDLLSVATAPDPDRARKASDDELARELLAGKVSKHGGVVTYIKPGSQEEKARAALARRIRDLTPRGFTFELLALAIDPETKSDFIEMVPTRKIKFENPKTGNRSQWQRDLLIADFIRRQLPKEAIKKVDRAKVAGKKGKKLTKIIESRGRGILEAAYAAACEKYGISRATVQEVWARYRKAMNSADN